MTIHAWFSIEAAIHRGISVYRTPNGSTIKVTRTGPKAQGPADERYIGEVIPAECGGCLWPKLWGSYASARAAHLRSYLPHMSRLVSATNSRRRWN